MARRLQLNQGEPLFIPSGMVLVCAGKVEACDWYFIFELGAWEVVPERLRGRLVDHHLLIARSERALTVTNLNVIQP